MAKKNILIKKKNGTTWDELYPITTANNVKTSDGSSVEAHLEDYVKFLNGEKTMTGGLAILSATKPYVKLGNYGLISTWAGGGLVVLGMNCYIDGNGKWHYAVTHPTSGARAIWMQYNQPGKVFFMETGAMATTADAEFTPPESKKILTQNDMFYGNATPTTLAEGQVYFQYE